MDLMNRSCSCAFPQAEAAGPVSKQVGDHDNPAPTVPATDDEGYQPEAEEAVADSESSSTSSSSSGKNKLSRWTRALMPGLG